MHIQYYILPLYYIYFIPTSADRLSSEYPLRLNDVTKPAYLALYMYSLKFGLSPSKFWIFSHTFIKTMIESSSDVLILKIVAQTML